MTESELAGPRAAATRNALYEAAAALFVERGYEDTTMADIAERAGTSRRTAFNHFPRKSDIPMVWTRRMADVAVDEAGVRAGEGEPAPEPSETDRICAYFRLIARLVEAEPELSRQMMLGWTSAAGPILYESQLLADLEPVLRAGQAHGRISADVDVAEAARTLSDVFMGAVLRWVRERDSARTLESVVDGCTALVLRAVRPVA